MKQLKEHLLYTLFCAFRKPIRWFISPYLVSNDIDHIEKWLKLVLNMEAFSSFSQV